LYPLTVNARYGNPDVSNIIETPAIKPYYSGSYAKEWTFVSINLDARSIRGTHKFKLRRQPTVQIWMVAPSYPLAHTKTRVQIRVPAPRDPHTPINQTTTNDGSNSDAGTTRPTPPQKHEKTTDNGLERGIL